MGEPTAAPEPTTVRLFASLREVAGTSTLTSTAPTVAALCGELAERFGPEFARRLQLASVLVDGDPEPRDSTRGLAGVREVALLPPFSGG